MSPKISVVIPVYNRTDTVRRTLHSVREQTFADFECIVVDDGSADGEALRRVVESLNDPRFRYLRRANGGGGAARNTGIDAAEGEIIAFLDSDDLWLPSKLRIQAEQLAEFTMAVAYCQAYVDRGVGRRWIRPIRGLRPDEDVGDYLFVANEFIQTSTIALPASAARAVRWDPDLQKGQDLDFVLRLAGIGLRFAYCPEPLVIWHDVTEEARTSRSAGTASSMAFLAKHEAALTERALRGYRVNYLAYDIAREKPAQALRDLAAGAASGVPLRIVLRQLLRAFLPRGVYRILVNRFVAAAGK